MALQKNVVELSASSTLRGACALDSLVAFDHV